MQTSHEQFWVLDAAGHPLFGSATMGALPREWWRRADDALRASARDQVTLALEGVQLTAWRLVSPGVREARALALRVRVASPVARVGDAYDEAPACAGMTPRQAQVCEYAASGATVDEIAAYLGIRAGTVRTHLKTVYRNLGVANRVELARAMGQLPALA